MIEREGLDSEARDIRHDSGGCRNEINVERSVATEKLSHSLHHVYPFGRKDHGQIVAFLMERHGGDESRESETVVAMKM